MGSDGYETDDSDLRAAIAASLGDPRATNGSQAGTSINNAVDLTGDTDSEHDVLPTYPNSKSVIGSETSRDESETPNYDEDLKRALAMSLQDLNESAEGVSTTDSPSSSPSSPVSNEVEIAGSKNLGTGFLGMDRKRMEEERLARIAKRKAESPILVDEPEAKQLKTEVSQVSQRKGAVRSVQDLESMSRNSGSDTAPTGRQTPSIQFATGTVKKTFAFGHRRVGDDVKIEEVFQKSDLELAVLSSFLWDMEWLFSKLDIKNTRFILIMQAKDEATKKQYESETATMRNLRLCFPPMDGQVNCMHSKLMLLFHAEHLRIAVPTANLVPFDWGEWGGIMENSVFLIDLPKRGDKISREESNTCFYKELIYFLKASTLHENIISKLGDFDFSKTAQLAFVHTIGGSHIGDSWKQTGYCGLGRALDSLGLKASGPISLDFVTSSLGFLNEEFMRCIYFASQGDNGTTELAIRTAKSFPIKNPSDPKRLVQRATVDEWKERFRVYFPSQDTVTKSKGGLQSAGTICFQSKWYEGPKFPQHILRDCESQRPGLLMHNKILYVRPDEPISLSDTTQCRAWAYVGSANLSESAWGRLVHDRTTKQPKLNCRNWECGVIIPVIEHKQKIPAKEGAQQSGKLPMGPLSSATEKSQIGSTKDLPEIFRDIVPIPMRVPGTRYHASRKPWYFQETDR